MYVLENGMVKGTVFPSTPLLNCELTEGNHRLCESYQVCLSITVSATQEAKRKGKLMP